METHPTDRKISLLDLHLSKTLMAPESTPVGECVERMKNRNTGSILIVADRSPAIAVGIFTERDLIKQFQRLIKPDAHLLPVRNFMTRGVVSIPYSKLNDAGTVMLDKGIRHLVVMHEGVRSKEGIAGMVSMRDLFRVLVRKTEGTIDHHAFQFRDVILFSAVEETRRIMRTMMNRFEFVSLETVEKTLGAEKRPYSNTDLLILDLDQQVHESWFHTLDGVLNRPDRAARVILLYHPSGHDHETVAKLEKLGDDHAVMVVAKPFTEAMLVDWLTE